MKYLGVRLIKKMRDLYIENYKTLMKENSNEWKSILCSWIGRITIVTYYYI
jgi:hypothetical protein